MLVIRADNADPAAVTAAVEQTVRSWAASTSWSTTPGSSPAARGGDDTAQADRLWAVDVRAVFVAAQAAARHMGEGGRIITIGSALAERVPSPA